MTRIGFYGHSSVSWANVEIYGVRSWIDIVIEKLGYELACIGVREGSEERILHSLKKTKNIDIAVIFHSLPSFMFLPQCNRDIQITEFDDAKSEYLWQDRQSTNKITQAKQQYFNFGGIKDAFHEEAIFINTLQSYYKFLYTPELHVDRFNGAFIQIDQYCSTKNIKAIHVPARNNFPSWYKLTSGKSYPEVMDTVYANWEMGYPNGITAEGQALVAEQMIAILQDL
jgi:hypothetical protein